MPPTSRAAVSYKKKDGHLTVSDDVKYVFWTPATPPSASPSVTIPVPNITNLQQTPESSPKVALKVFVGDENHVFSFTSKENARKEQELITDTLRNAITANKASAVASQIAPSAAGSSTPNAAARAQNGADTGQSAAMAIAKAVSSKAGDEGWYDDNQLRADYKLQRSLLESNKPLAARFNQALSERPESVSASQFTTQFWSARLHLLRAHAIEKAQKQGEYNVLPEIKFVRKPAEKEGDPDIKQLKITKEQIKLIFKQYPVVSAAYNENVPPLDAGQFWQRFFGSRLLKKLKGEKITQQDPPDGIMDRYLEERDDRPMTVPYIPHFIDLEGNEQNHSQRQGNRPDLDMRPSSYDKVPILRVLNNLSEKMLAHVPPEDSETHGPIGMDEETFEQLRLRDLASDDVDNRVHLSVREQKLLLNDQDDLSADAKKYAQQDPQKVLATLRSDLRPKWVSSKTGGINLNRAIRYTSDDDSDSDEEVQQPKNASSRGLSKKPPRIGSQKAMKAATSSIFASIRQRRSATATDADSLHGLSQTVFDQLTITQNTTIEFLHYFWTVFLSGDSSRTAELAQLVSTLNRSLDRIGAVASAAEAEREKKIQSVKNQMREYERKTGKRRKLDTQDIEGGKAVVDAMLRRTVAAIAQATKAYSKALREQTTDAGPSDTAAQ